MHINNLVCTLEQAIKLKELGLDQDEVQFYYTRPIDPFRKFTSETFEVNHRDRNWTYENNTTNEIDGKIAAYTGMEIGDMLTGLEDANTSYYSNHLGFWQWQIFVPVNSDGVLEVTHSDQDGYATESEARAAMLIYALENKLISVEYCNDILIMNGDPFNPGAE